TEETGPFDVIMLDDPWLPALLLCTGEEKGSITCRLHHLEFQNNKRFQELELSDFLESCLRVCLYPYNPSYRPSSDRQVFNNSGFYALPFVGNSQLFCRLKTRPESSVMTSWEEVLKETVDRGKQGQLGYIMRVGPGNSIVTDFMPIFWSFDSLGNSRGAFWLL